MAEILISRCSSDLRPMPKYFFSSSSKNATRVCAIACMLLMYFKILSLPRALAWNELEMPSRDELVH